MTVKTTLERERNTDVLATDGGEDVDDTEHETSPPLADFDPWKIGQPDDGIVYHYKSAVDGHWRIIKDEDHALEEATNYPVGELVEQEQMGDYDESESGELRAIYVPPAEPDVGTEEPPIGYDGYPEHVTQASCQECGEIFYHRYHAEYCPYCGAGDDDSLTVLNIGSGVVCHRPPRSTETEGSDR